MNFSEISFLKYPYRLQYLFTLCTQNSIAFSSPTFIISSSVTHKQKKIAFKKCLPYFIIIATFTQPAAISRKSLQVTASKALGFFRLHTRFYPISFTPLLAYRTVHEVLKEIFAGDGIFVGGRGVAAEKKTVLHSKNFFFYLTLVRAFINLPSPHIYFTKCFSPFFSDRKECEDCLLRTCCGDIWWKKI